MPRDRSGIKQFVSKYDRTRKPTLPHQMEHYRGESDAADVSILLST